MPIHGLLVYRKATTQVLLDIFFRKGHSRDKFILHKGPIIKTLLEYKKKKDNGDESTFAQLCFKNTNKSVATSQTKLLVIQLFACRILVADVDDLQLGFKLRLDEETCSPVINFPHAWKGIKCHEDMQH
jgi:hypothetical protein